MNGGIFDGLGAYHTNQPAAGLVVAANTPRQASAGLGSVLETGKGLLTPSAPSLTMGGIASLVARGAAGYVVGAHLGHPLIGAGLGAIAPFPVVIFAVGGWLLAKEGELQ